MNISKTIPWVEKYRPTKFDNIILDDVNESIFKNVMKTSHFPNMLFYGPPGTGKTTSIMNLVDNYFKNNNMKNYKSSVIHLNASDDRGIDIIRNQILQFVSSNGIYNKGYKFVILDEVDYMTKNAQQALKHLLQLVNNNIRFCLICNYISKIDVSLKNEFICIRFNKLPNEKIHNYLKHIVTNEDLKITDDTIQRIQYKFGSDIRSMINYIQLNQFNWSNNYNIVDDSAYEKIHCYFLEHHDCNSDASSQNIISFIYKMSILYNTNILDLIKEYFNYIIKYKTELINKDLLNDISEIMHTQNVKNEHLILQFSIIIMKHVMKKGSNEKG